MGYYNWEDVRDFIGRVASTFAIVVAFLMGSGRIISELSFPGDYAKIEQLRRDVASTYVGSNEDVIGQVTQWNQIIESNKRYRSIWWSRLCVSGGWDKVELIPIPEEEPNPWR